MSAFLPWLYVHYIKPYLDACSREGYEAPLSLMEGELAGEAGQDYARAVEFWATRSFLLGLRTGAGLSDLLRR